jgi:hypothetical protein
MSSATEGIPSFTRLTRTRNTVLSRISVWTAPGQIIVVNTGMAHESYRRILLEDVRAFVAHPTNRKKVLESTLIGLALGLYGLTSLIASEWLWTLLILVIPAILVVRSWSHGPSVRVQVVTKAQTFPLPALHRRRELDRLRAFLQSENVLVPPGGMETPLSRSRIETDVPPLPPNGPAPIPTIRIQPSAE